MYVSSFVVLIYFRTTFWKVKFPLPPQMKLLPCLHPLQMSLSKKLVGSNATKVFRHETMGPPSGPATFTSKICNIILS